LHLFSFSFNSGNSLTFLIVSMFALCAIFYP
jgi:hypothetical protein